MSKHFNLLNQKFGKWTVIGESEKKGKWECQCECGNLSSKTGSCLRRGESTQCKKCSYLSRTNNLLNQKFGKWTVIERTKNKNNTIYWKCKCECGKIKEVSGNSLKRKSSIQCRECYYIVLKENLLNQKFGKWTVIENREGSYWYCKCECGNKKKIRACKLKSGLSTQCSRCRDSKNHSFNHAKSSKSAILYLIECFNENEKFYKIGITIRSVKKRFNSKKSMPYQFKNILEIKGESNKLYYLEKELHLYLYDYKYVPNIKFLGQNECYILNKKILNIFNKINE